MNAKERIQQALKRIMSESKVTACQVYKSWDYDGVLQAYGWWYKPFGCQPRYLGKSLSDALNSIDDRVSEKEGEE